jgi:hypothetical protein
MGKCFLTRSSLFVICASASLGLPVLLAGCGGASGASSTSLSKAEFVKRANAICEKARKDGGNGLRRYSKQHEQAGSSAEEQAEMQAAGIQAVVLPRIEQQNEELEALGTPAGDHAMLDEYLASLQKVATKGTEGAPIPETQLVQLFDPSSKAARAYGIEECAYS